MRTYTPPAHETRRAALRAVALLAMILTAVALVGYFTSPAHGTTCGTQVQAQVLPAFPSYTSTPFFSNTLNQVGFPVRVEAVQQWVNQTAHPQAQPQLGLSAAQLRALLAQAEAAEGQLPAQAPGATPEVPAQPQATAPNIPPYAYAGDIPTIIQHCAKCHTDSYSPEGAAGGVLLDGSVDLRAPQTWAKREAINQALADRRMPPQGHEFSGAIAGQIHAELYKGVNAGGNPAKPESSP